MKQTLNYNIHNILKLRITRNRAYGFRDLINLKLSTFQVDEVDRPDIVLNIGKFRPATEGCYLLDHKYHVRENYFYCRDSGGSAAWEVEINGVEDGETTINFDVRRGLTLQSFINPDLIPQTLLTTLAEYRLNRKGYALVHSAAVSKGGEAYLLCGRGSSFKTSLCMDLVRRADFTCLGDDRVILNGNEALSFFLQPSLFRFMMEHLENETGFGMMSQAHYVQHLIRRDYETLKPWGEPARVKALLFITRWEARDKQQVIDRVDPSRREEIVSALVENNRLENFTYQLPQFKINSAPFLKYMLAYAFVFPQSPIAMQETALAANLRRALQSVVVYKVNIPAVYRTTTFEQIRDLLAGG